ncbi:TMV resistance protein [Salix suchowensis]|nr:TMV resistance protein [Salix suchowensis]
METILIAYDLWDIVEGLPQLQQNPGAESDSTGEGSEAESTPEEKHAATRENKIKNAKALSLIQGALSDDLFPRIRNEKSAQGAWNVLKREYRGDKRVRAVKLQAVRGEFEYMRMEENESLEHYLAKFFEVVNSLKSLGEEVPEKRIVQKLLMSLTEEVIASVKVFDKREDMHDEREEQRGTKNAFSSFKVGYNQGPANNKFKVTQSGTKGEMCIIIIAQAGTIELESTTTIPTTHRTYKAAAVKV